MSVVIPVVVRSCSEDLEALAEVQRTIASGKRWLRFSDALERRYEADTRQRRLRFLTVMGIGGGLIYNLFLISDCLILSDAFRYLVAGRLGLITPLFVALLLLMQRLKSRWSMEKVAAIGTVVASIMPLIVMIHSDSPYRLHFQLGMLLLMVYCTMIQQLPVKYAAVSLTCMLIAQLITTYIAGFMDFVMWQANSLLYLSAVVLLLMASYFLERSSRLSYLFALRGRLLQVQLTEMARTDPLTQLFNRRYQGEVTALVWEQTQTAPTPVAVILLDIDHFKAYNDNYGHLQGDICLKLLSGAIQRTVQDAGALAFRFGGEEILVLMVDADASQTRALAETLRAAVVAMNMPHPAMGEGARVTISLGMANGLAPFSSFDHLMACADDALYAAKSAGRNCLRCAGPEAVSG
jgi:diguanylate cyclase (GGDEF)-like protein